MGELIIGVAFVFAAYLVGAVPTAHIFGRRTGREIRSMGSGNVGALNALRSLGKAVGVLVFGVDTGKAALMMVTATFIGVPDWSMYAGALSTMLGHNFSVFIGFYGGKGAAVMSGISLVIVPYLALLSIPALLLGYVIFRSAFWGMMMTFISINILTVLTGQPVEQIVLCVVLTLLVGMTHFLRTYRTLWPAIKTLDFHRIGEIE
ncbi:MAG TPA: glycerol-3-phosphate acyltransferase [Dehalococcoidia bacterium]|jgi:glycerol-3-phosphate acyltransferase PlsY|nr:hypothetical protein [Chloroflexota bacterium]MDP5876267.1 glycerol-3-phosphate acyltransferase [Dehalococcoidia bacterium]MDP6274477.1 glycerol-3-phosphate acyltransferase [Dehalococcoidia bacterium]MDP7160601.1 glycerol-3-phosphate acyltransferase [Dehalococcoidia bacterium]MDP7514838.1 glycerol-3-phosphate acyltransferase [Dehalococcoidia bacterium]